MRHTGLLRKGLKKKKERKCQTGWGGYRGDPYQKNVNELKINKNIKADVNTALKYESASPQRGQGLQEINHLVD